MDLLNDAIDKLHAMRLRDEDDVTAKACEDIAERSGKIKDLLDGTITSGGKLQKKAARDNLDGLNCL